MAHDFSISSSTGKTEFFFGYAGGVVYDAFNARAFDAGSSGNGGGKTVTAEEVRSAIDFLKADSRSTSPVIDLVNKMEGLLGSHADGVTYEVGFS